MGHQALGKYLGITNMTNTNLINNIDDIAPSAFDISLENFEHATAKFHEQRSHPGFNLYNLNDLLNTFKYELSFIDFTVDWIKHFIDTNKVGNLTKYHKIIIQANTIAKGVKQHIEFLQNIDTVTHNILSYKLECKFYDLKSTIVSFKHWYNSTKDRKQSNQELGFTDTYRVVDDSDGNIYGTKGQKGYITDILTIEIIRADHIDIAQDEINDPVQKILLKYYNKKYFPIKNLIDFDLTKVSEDTALTSRYGLNISKSKYTTLINLEREENKALINTNWQPKIKYNSANPNIQLGYQILAQEYFSFRAIRRISLAHNIPLHKDLKNVTLTLEHDYNTVNNALSIDAIESSSIDLFKDLIHEYFPAESICYFITIVYFIIDLLKLDSSFKITTVLAIWLVDIIFKIIKIFFNNSHL